MNWLKWIFQIDPRVTDEQLRRQGLLVMIISVFISIVTFVLLLNSIFTGRFTIGTAANFFGVFIYVISIVMVRSGIVRATAYMITWATLLSIVLVLVMGPSPISAVYLAVPILLASLVLSSQGVFPIALFGLLAVLYAINYHSGLDSSSYFSVIGLLIMICALAYLGAWSVERAFKIVQEIRHNLEVANRELNQANNTLEDRVTQRTSALEQALKNLGDREAELHETLSELRSSQEAIRELSAPILPVASGVLVAPIIGALDSARVSVLLSSLLATVERERARYLILDVTGTPVIDTQVAQALLKVTQALRLLGSQVILTGIRPEVAQTLVSLGIDLITITTRATLQDGIAEAVRHSQAG